MLLGTPQGVWLMSSSWPLTKGWNAKIFYQAENWYFRYFFMVFTGLILLGVFNGLVFLPVLLLMVGPPAEVVPKDGGDEVDLSTTEVIRGGQNRRSSMRSNPLQNTKPPPQNNLQNLKINAGSLPKRHCHHSDASLSTIAEESGSYVSQHDNASINALPLTSQSLNGASVKIEPEITVETTTHPLVSFKNLDNFWWFWETHYSKPPFFVQKLIFDEISQII